MKDLIQILELTGHKKKKRMNEWVKEYPNNSAKGYYESYYVLFKDTEGMFFCADGDLNQITKIYSVEECLKKNPYLRDDLRVKKINQIFSKQKSKKGYK